MRFPTTWTRYKGTVPAGGIVLGTDAFPTNSDNTYRKPNAKDDNTLASRIVSINGWPLSRIAVACIQSAASGAVALPISAYVWEDTLGFWIQLAGSTTTITPGISTTGSGVAAVPVFFDVMSLIDFPHVGKDLNAVNPGSVDILFLVGDNSAPSGSYIFVAGGELTTKPF